MTVKTVDHLGTYTLKVKSIGDIILEYKKKRIIFFFKSTL